MLTMNFSTDAYTKSKKLNGYFSSVLHSSALGNAPKMEMVVLSGELKKFSVHLNIALVMMIESDSMIDIHSQTTRLISHNQTTVLHHPSRSIRNCHPYDTIESYELFLYTARYVLCAPALHFICTAP